MVVFKKPHALTDAVLSYCPGCTHGIVHRLVAEAIDELGILGSTVASPRWAAPSWPMISSTAT